MNQQALKVPTPPNDTPTVLVVEDEILVRNAAAQYLRGCGFFVVEAVNADEALAMLHAVAEVDVVFSDVKLPGPRNGADLAQIIQKDFPHVKVLLTSGVTPLPELEGIRLLRKPYFLFEVERQIRRLLTPISQRL